MFANPRAETSPEAGRKELVRRIFMAPSQVTISASDKKITYYFYRIDSTS